MSTSRSLETNASGWPPNPDTGSRKPPWWLGKITRGTPSRSATAAAHRPVIWRAGGITREQRVVAGSGAGAARNYSVIGPSQEVKAMKQAIPAPKPPAR